MLLPQADLVERIIDDLDYFGHRLSFGLDDLQLAAERDTLDELSVVAEEVAVRLTRLDRLTEAREAFAVAGLLSAGDLARHQYPAGEHRIALRIPGAPEGVLADSLGPGGRSRDPGRWLRAVNLALIGGRTDAVGMLMRMPVAQGPTRLPHHYPLVAAIRALVTEPGQASPAIETYRAAVPASSAHFVTQLMLDHVDRPLGDVLAEVAARRPAGLDAALRGAIVGHERYWARAGSTQPACWLSIPCLALVAIARIQEVEVEVDHTYLPTSLLAA